MPGWAVVGARKGRLYVMGWSAMRHGSVMNGWVQATDGDVRDVVLGELARQALARSTTNASMPSFRSAESPINALLAAASVTSYNAYAASAREVYVDLDDEVPGLVITPTRNGGPGEGWTRLEELAIRLDREISDEQLGQSVRRGCGGFRTHRVGVVWDRLIPDK
jgi:hypothetical protein